MCLFFIKKLLKFYCDRSAKAKKESKLKDVNKIISIVKNKKKKLEQFDYKLQDKISKLEEEIEFYRNHDDCPTCKQNIDNEFKCDIVDKRQESLTETNSGFAKLKEEYAKIDTELAITYNSCARITALNMLAIKSIPIIRPSSHTAYRKSSA